MADIISGELPQWLQQRATGHWTDNTPLFMQGMELGQRAALRNKELAIMATNALVENKWREAQTDAALLKNAETALELQDASTIQKAQRIYLGGDKEVAPELQSARGVAVWRNWKTTIDAEQADATEWQQFLDSFAKLDGEGRAAVRDQGWPIQRGQITRKHYEVLSEEQRRQREEAFQLKSDTRIVEVDGVKFLRGPTGSLHPVPKDYSEGAPAVPIIDEDGNIVGHGIQNSRGGITQLRAPTSKRHPLQNKLDGLRAQLAGEQARGTKGFDSTKAKELKAEIATVEKTIEQDQPVITPKPAGSVQTNAPAILRYDPTTRTFH